jgi:glutathione S-transferase
MKVHGHPLSTCTRKIFMTLSEKGATADLVPIDLLAGAHRAPSHRALHPFAKVPVLEDDGAVIYESRAILRYLDRKLGGAPLTPADALGAAEMDRWLSVDQSYVAPHIRALVGEVVLKKAHGDAPDPQVIAAARLALDEAFAVLDGALVDRAYLTGAFSLADISLVPYVDVLEWLEVGDLLDARPSLRAWRDRVRSRPSWKVATAL